MKKLYAFLLAAFFASAASAQIIDTVLFENFQVDKFSEWPIYPEGNDLTWINVDEDGITPYDGDDNHWRWFYDEVFYNSEDTLTGEINYCAASFSYLVGAAPGNRNWLVTPPITVTDANYTLHWKSAPWQMPRYLDGYLVMASTGSNDMYSGAFVDTLFQAASMVSFSDGNSLDPSDYVFTPGYIHADTVSDWDYMAIWTVGDSTLLHGILEPHSVSLSAYAGQTIYLAFLHNADDDFYFSIDDVLVVRSETSPTNELNTMDLRFVTYPNPAENWLNVLYRLPNAASVSLSVTDMGGRTVLESAVNQLQQAGEQQKNLNVHSLASGAYNLILKIDGQSFTKTFVKK